MRRIIAITITRGDIFRNVYVGVTLGRPFSTSMWRLEPSFYPNSSRVRGTSTPILSPRSSSSPTNGQERESRLCKLSDEIFSRGNVHLKNVERLTALPEGLHSFPEICFIGKPNTGKSTLISALLHNAMVGKPSGKTGNTRLLKFFNVGDALALVDTPGYGGWVGGRPLSERVMAFAILFRYLSLRSKGQGLKRVYWVMESSAFDPMQFQPRDEELLYFLRSERIPFSVILSKIDRHWRHLTHSKETERKGPFHIQRDGTPQVVQQQVERRSSSQIFDRFQSSVQRNTEEIYQFLGGLEAPVLPVHAHRFFPQHWVNVDVLRDDLTKYCCSDIQETHRLTLQEVKALSYAPPTADDIQEIQLKYPLESFLVPQDDNVSIAQMVEAHERGKRHLLESRFHSLLPLQIVCSGLEQNSGEVDDVLFQASPQYTASAEGKENISLEKGNEVSRLDSSTSECLSLTGSQGSVESNVVALPTPIIPVTPAEERVLTHKPQEQGTTPLFLATLEKASSLVGSSATNSVTAMNGVRIPWSLIPVSLEQLMEEDRDEMATFAQRSGAGALEALFHHEALADAFVNARGAFLEHSNLAKDPLGLKLEEQLPLHATVTTRQSSVVARQKKKFLQKYLDRRRKERSVYVSAEGYMCPWLSSSSGMAAESSVMGMTPGSSSRGTRAGSGALMKDLKRVGFGGQSYSGRTMKNRGRSTKKTGFWAA